MGFDSSASLFLPAQTKIDAYEITYEEWKFNDTVTGGNSCLLRKCISQEKTRRTELSTRNYF